MNSIAQRRGRESTVDAATEGGPHRAMPNLRPFIVAGLVLLVAAGAFAFGAVQPWAQFMLKAGAVVLFLLWGVQVMARRGAEIHAVGPALALACFGGVVAAQIALQATAYRFATVEELTLYAAYALLFLVAANVVRNRDGCRTCMVSVEVFAFLLSAFAIVQGLYSNGKLYWILAPRFGGWEYGPYVNRNHFAGMMELLLPFPLLLASGRVVRARWRMAAAVVAVVAGASVVLSASRAGMLALAVEIVFISWLSMRGSSGRLVVRNLIVLTVVVLVVAISLDRGRSLLRFVKAGEEDAVRVHVLRDSWAMFKEKPVAGWGAGTFGIVYPQFQSFYSIKTVGFAHDDYLQVLLETGLLGFACIAAFLCLVIRNGLRHTRNWRHSWRAAAQTAALLGVIGLLVHSFFDFNLHIPANAAMFFVLSGIAAGVPAGDSSRAQSSNHLRQAPEVVDDPVDRLPDGNGVGQ